MSFPSLTWSQVQPYVLLAWPVVTALASLAYTALDKTSRGHAFLSGLASLGLDLPKLLDALRRLVAGSGKGGGSVTSLTPTAKPPTPPVPPAAARMMRRRGILDFVRPLAAAIAIALPIVGPCALVGCKTLFPNGGTVAGDVTDLITDLGTVIQTAETLWPVVATFIPADKLPAAQAQYTGDLQKTQQAQAALEAFKSGLPADGGTASATDLVKAAQAASDALFDDVIGYLTPDAGVDAGATLASNVPTLLQLEQAHQAVDAWK